MFQLWCEAGFVPDGFWKQTPRLLQVAINGYSARLESERESRMVAAWHMAAFTRSKKMPKLRDLLKKEGVKAKAQTPEQMIAVMQSFVKN